MHEPANSTTQNCDLSNPVPALSALCVRVLCETAPEFDSESQAVLAQVLGDLESAVPLTIANQLAAPDSCAGLYTAMPDCLDSCRQTLTRKPKACARILTALHDALLGEAVSQQTHCAVEGCMDFLMQSHRYKKDWVLPQLHTAGRNSCRRVKKQAARFSGQQHARFAAEDAIECANRSALAHRYRMSALDQYRA